MDIFLPNYVRVILRCYNPAVRHEKMPRCTQRQISPHLRVSKNAIRCWLSRSHPSSRVRSSAFATMMLRLLDSDAG
jgi:hypothetical protein